MYTAASSLVQQSKQNKSQNVTEKKIFVRLFFLYHTEKYETPSEIPVSLIEHTKTSLIASLLIVKYTLVCSK